MDGDTGLYPSSPFYYTNSWTSFARVFMLVSLVDIHDFFFILHSSNSFAQNPSDS